MPATQAASHASNPAPAVWGFTRRFQRGGLARAYIFSAIVVFTIGSLTGGSSQLLILPIFVILASLYSFAMWKWYQKDLKLEIKNTKLTSSIWLPSALLLAFIIFQQLVPIESSANQNTAVQLIQQQPAFAFW